MDGRLKYSSNFHALNDLRVELLSRSVWAACCFELFLRSNDDGGFILQTVSVCRAKGTIITSSKCVCLYNPMHVLSAA